MAISVATTCGRICVQPKLGELLRKEIIESMGNESGTVEVDFSGVKILTSSFLNVAVGSLYGKSDEATVDAITWLGLDESDQSLLSVVIENAKRFYSLNEEQKNNIIENNDDLTKE